jgi:short-subunit dehydrogenase
MKLQGQTALVTGASSGLGAAFARNLALRGANLVIVARRAERLEALAGELRERFGVDVLVLAMDLSSTGAPQKLFDQTEGAGRRIDLLFNNAGFGSYGTFFELDWAETTQQLELNMLVPTELAYRFGRAMKARGRGRIVNIASLAGYSPMPYYATYGGTKAYVRTFSEALAFELKGSGVTVTVVNPGVTLTEFHQVARQTLPPIARLATMSAEQCAEIALEGALRGKANVVPGLLNKLMGFLMSLAPSFIAVPVTALTVGAPKR